MSLLVVGSVAFDANETPHGKRDRTLGGAASYFALAASHFAPVQMVAVVGEDFTKKDEAVFRPVLPEAYRDSAHIFLGNIDPTLQRSVLGQMRRKPKVVGLDTMNFWIEGTPSQLRETLKGVDILAINDDETRQLTSEHNLLRAARHIFKMGPSTLIVKRGENGAMMIHDKFIFSVPAFPLEEVRDPTGAGDTFAGGFMGYLTAASRINEQTLRSAMVYGSVLASFTVERFGVERLARVTRKEITSRARLFSKLTSFKL